MIYRIFDIGVRSDRRLSSLAEWPGGVVSAEVHFLEHAFQETGGYRHIHQWRGKDGGEVMSCAELNGRYLLQFPNGADYIVDPETGNVFVQRFAPSSYSRTSELVQDQILPRLVAHWGRLVVHASAVLLPQRKVAIFFGDTGRGKSTLAASFYQSGFELLTDDCLLLDTTGEVVCAVPAYRGLRLWPDTATALEIDQTGEDIQQGSAGKYRLESRKRSDKEESLAVGAFFFLGDPDHLDGNEEVVSIQRQHGAEELMTLIEAAFNLDPVSPEHARRNFESLGRIAAFGIPVFKLNYKRSYGVLPKVQETVLKAIGMGCIG